MKIKKVLFILRLIFIYLITLLLISCSSSFNTKHDTDKKTNVEEGIHLELHGVADEYKSIFVDNFQIVVNGHENLIYRKSEYVKELSDTFSEDRPDLKNAKLVYDTDKNKVEFIYYYKPNADDIDSVSHENLMIVRLLSYNYIGMAISDYFSKCKSDLASMGVSFDKPEIFISYFVKENYYINSYKPSLFKILIGVQLPNKDLAEIEGTFVTGPVLALVHKPQKNIKGGYTEENALNEFFAVEYDDTNNHMVVETEGIENNSSVTTPEPEYIQTIDSNNITYIEEIYQAAMDGNVEIISEAINNGFDINNKNEVYFTIFMEAAANGQIDTVKYLHKLGAEIDSNDINGGSAFFWSVYYDYTDVALYLLDNGADPHIIGEFKMTPLIWAVRNNNYTLVKALLEAGVDANAAMDQVDDIGDCTPLSIAKANRCKEIENILNDYGATN